MPGYEDLTPEQMMSILWMVLIIVSIYVFGHLGWSFMNWRAAKYLQFKVEREVVKNIVEQVRQPTLFNRIKLWWVERKVKKEILKGYKVPKNLK